MAKKKEISESNLSEYKPRLEIIFEPWRLKKLKVAKQLISFSLEISDFIRTKKMPNKILQAYFHVLTRETDVKIGYEDLSNFARSHVPIIILSAKANKIGYLLLTEHYINSLFSENPSLAAHDKISIPWEEFTPLNKSQLKRIREFTFNLQKPNSLQLESGTYFNLKDGLRDLVLKAIVEIENLNIDVNLETLRKIESDINRAIYTVAIVGPTKAGKSTIINSLISKNVSPIDIRPTTGIPMNIVPGKKEYSEILFKNEGVIMGKADPSFLNQYVTIDQNRSNFKEVKMVTVWVRSSQMEKGLSFCDFPGLDDADPVIERTVANAMQFVNAIIYVIDASGNQKGYKFPKQYRDDLQSLKNKDRIFLVINKIDDFTDEKLLADYKSFIDEQLEFLGLKEFLPYPPIYMVASKSFERRQAGNYSQDEISLLEEQVWNHLLANSKSGLHNLLNIVGEISQECERLSRTVKTRMLSGDKQLEISNSLQSTNHELAQIRSYEKDKRQKITRWLYDTLQSEQGYLIANYKNYLFNVGLGYHLPANHEISKYLTDQFILIAPDIFEKLEMEITGLNNDLNRWVNNRLQSVEINIDKYSSQDFQHSDEFFQLLKPIANIFSESYGKRAPTDMLGNFFYHISNAFDSFGDWIWELFTNKQIVRNRKVDGIISKLEECCNQVFDKIYLAFFNHLNAKCNELLEKVIDRTDIYVSGLEKQIKELHRPLSQSEKQVYDQACDKLAGLDDQCASVRLQINEYSVHLKPTLPDTVIGFGAAIETIELELRKLINDIITTETGVNDGKKLIPAHLQPKVEDRILKVVRDHPNSKVETFKSLETCLQFFDLTEYFDIISNRQYWIFFASTFNNKENLNKHFLQLGNLRNSVRHSRNLTPLVIAEGEASILWFKMALKINTYD